MIYQKAHTHKAKGNKQPSSQKNSPTNKPSKKCKFIIYLSIKKNFTLKSGIYLVIYTHMYIHTHKHEYGRWEREEWIFPS